MFFTFLGMFSSNPPDLIYPLHLSKIFLQKTFQTSSISQQSVDLASLCQLLLSISVIIYVTAMCLSVCFFKPDHKFLKSKGVFIYPLITFTEGVIPSSYMCVG